jgi:polyketide cyclase/dehydrase/lipid transport protein
MATVEKVILTKANPDAVWDAIRDVGALHTRLVRGFVTNTRLEPGARIVTFANGAIVREPIVTIDDAARRLVWSAEGGLTTHYNSAVQVFAESGSTRVVWTSDFLPDTAASQLEVAMEAGARAMKATLDASA